ncbi:NAD(P)-dependent oxidoreductase [Streptomyces sp. Rer75]|uniref:NAD(P)-dependent oxidoreductase n=1 Tax=Streptomyces sp. Rer75 TaxID=2750011 RepID=UPI0015D00504|nr:hypothetical protein HYQ63_00920 [Streptomyces sp. Rer75]
MFRLRTFGRCSGSPGGWLSFTSCCDVSGTALGLVGFGRIARATAERALGFGVTVRYTARSGPAPPERLGHLVDRVQHTEWDELVGTSDFVSLHVPLTARGRGVRA